MNKLKFMSVYLIGAMESCNNNGKDWRDNITPYLKNMGLIVLNPLNKSIYTAGQEIINEDEEFQRRMKILKDSGQYDRYAELVKQIRYDDLRMVDNAGFLICYLDLNLFACGTFEELFIANRQMKPVLVVCKQGKKKIPGWLFATLPHQHMFNSFNELFDYLHLVNDGKVESYKRWKFLDIEEQVLSIVNKK